MIGPVARLAAFARRNAIGLLALAVALGGTSYAAISKIPGPGGKISACYKKRGGNLRVVDAKTKCRRGERSLAFSQKGPRGLPGAAGQQGEKGEKGTQGDTGPATGPASGDLTGNYPSPTIAAGAVTPAKIGVIPQVSASRGTDFNAPDNTRNVVAFDTTEFETAEMHDDVTNNGRLVAPIAGVYQVNANVRWTGAAQQGTGGRFVALVRLDPVTETIASSWVEASDVGATDQSVSALVKLPAAGAVRLEEFQDSTATQQIKGSANGIPAAHISMTWVGAG